MGVRHPAHGLDEVARVMLGGDRHGDENHQGQQEAHIGPDFQRSAHALASTSRISLGSVIGSKGFLMTPAAPIFKYPATSSVRTLAVMKMTGISLVSGLSLSRASVAGPSMSGIITSSNITSGFSPAASESASAPEEASTTCHRPTPLKLTLPISLMSASSSTIKTLLTARDISSLSARQLLDFSVSPSPGAAKPSAPWVIRIGLAGFWRPVSRSTPSRGKASERPPAPWARTRRRRQARRPAG